MQIERGVLGCRKQQTDILNTVFLISNTKSRLSLDGTLNPNSRQSRLQNAPFCVAKLALLECKTGTFRMQNWQF